MDSPERDATPQGPEAEVERYLRSGDYDCAHSGWPGANLIARAQNADRALRGALVAEVVRRTPHATEPAELAHLDVVDFTRAKVGPMVRGLFPRREQEAILDTLGCSVVFLSPANIESVLGETHWLGTAWDLANLYLASFGAELLGPEARPLLGLAEETTSYVSIEYLRGGGGRFDDVIVHEAAHLFHNCKRRTLGLPETRRREWPLELAFAKRETFAYACEAYSRILEQSRTGAERRHLLDELAAEPPPPDARVDPGDYLEILHGAVEARNGWKRILAGCAPSRGARVAGRPDLPPASPGPAAG